MNNGKSNNQLDYGQAGPSSNDRDNEVDPRESLGP